MQSIMVQKLHKVSGQKELEHCDRSSYTSNVRTINIYLAPIECWDSEACWISWKWSLRKVNESLNSETELAGLK